jgi:S1-C subfamily serine protease
MLRHQGIHRVLPSANGRIWKLLIRLVQKHPMSNRSLILLTGLLGFGLGIFMLGCFRSNADMVESAYIPPNRQTQKNLESIARSITVGIVSGDNWGSGILIRKSKNSKGFVYDILTNYHVLLFGLGKKYRVVTPDGKSYPATRMSLKNLSQQDLGILQFKSNKNYQIAKLSLKVKPQTGDNVLAAGFPYERRSEGIQGFTLSWGTIEQLNSSAFGGGYEIGYTNVVKKGMSGGPLLDQQGLVMGINGIHQYPLWGNPYVFVGGRSASLEEQKQMSQLSWAIPMQTFLRLAPQFLASDKASIPLSKKSW